MSLLITNIYIFVLATALALLEIQIEGPNGWARNLPTWRPSRDKWYSRVYEKIMSGKELTGYHSAMFSFVFLVFLFPYFLGTTLNLENFLKTLSFFFIFIALWDFLWFVFNPFYPIKNFKRDNVNHKAWFLNMPVDYWATLAVSLAVVLVGQYLLNIAGLIAWWSENTLLFIVETIVSILFSIYVLDIDNWKKR